MNVSHKKVGLGLVALAVALMGSAAIADKGGMGMGGMGMGGPMGMAPAFDFAAADADKDGKITQEEFAAYRTAKVAAVDADKDGKLSADEIAAMHMKDAADHSAQMASEMVAHMDTDGDGLLSVGELLSMPMPQDAFTMADTNKDGAIDQAEADAAMQMMGRGHGGKGGRHGKGHGDMMGQGGN